MYSIYHVSAETLAGRPTRPISHKQGHNNRKAYIIDTKDCDMFTNLTVVSIILREQLI